MRTPEETVRILKSASPKQRMTLEEEIAALEAEVERYKQGTLYQNWDKLWQECDRAREERDQLREENEELREVADVMLEIYRMVSSGELTDIKCSESANLTKSYVKKLREENARLKGALKPIAVYVQTEAELRAKLEQAEAALEQLADASEVVAKVAGEEAMVVRVARVKARQVLAAIREGKGA